MSEHVTYPNGSLSSWSGSGSSYSATFTANAVHDTTNVITVSATGWNSSADGNAPLSGGTSLNYTITPPFVQSVTYNANEGNQTLLITFDDTIDASQTDLSKIHIREAEQSSGGVTLTGASVTNTDSTTITITTTEAQRIAIKHLATKQLDLDAGAVRNLASSFANEADNDETIAYTEDTTRPLINSLTVDDSMLTDADVGLGELVTTIVFNEEMNTAVFPVVEFLPDVYTTLSCGGAWSNNTTFLYTCDVTDAGVDVQGIDIRVTNARDIVTNNQMLSDTETDKFGIDTLNPTVQNLAVNDQWIGENNVGLNTFVVTVDFSETMNTSINPGIVFLPSVTSTLACNGVWTDSDTYTYSCDVTDADVEQEDIDIRISNARDSRQNTMVMYTGVDRFNIDTIKPTISITDNASGSWVNTDTITSNPADGIGIDNTKWIITNNSTCDSSLDASLNSGNSGITLTANDETTYYNKYICFRTMDYADNKQYVSSSQINRLDTSVPTTTGAVDKAPDGLNGWYVTDVEYTISPNCDTSGCAWTKYCFGDNCSIDDVNGAEYTVPLLITSQGLTLIRFRSKDNAGNIQEVQSSGIIKIDKTNPTTTGAITAGTLGTNDWYTTDVNYSLSPFDAPSDVNLTYYCVDSVNTCTPTTVYSSAIVLSTEGNNYVRFYSIDNAGNTQGIQSSGLIKIDKTDPTTTGAITSGTLASNGWYKTDVIFTITPSDATSSIFSTHYCIDNNNSCTPDLAYTVPLTLSTDGNNYVRFRSVDNAGNTQAIQSSVLIQIDKTPPIVTLSGSSTTNTITLSVSVNELSNCRYDANISKTFDQMSSGVDSNEILNYSWPVFNSLVSNTAYTYLVQCRNGVDFDSNSTITITTKRSTSGSSGGSSGGSGGTTIVEKTTVENYSSTSDEILNINQIRDILEESNLSEAELNEYLNLAKEGLINIERNLQVVKTTSSTGQESYVSTFTIVIRNTSFYKLQDLKFVEIIPKEVALDASLITSPYNFRVLVADPVIEFLIPVLNVGETIEIPYSVNNNVTEEQLLEMQEVLYKYNFQEAKITPVPVIDLPKDETDESISQVVSVTELVSDLEKSKNNGWLWWVLIVVLIIVALFFIFSKKNQKIKLKK